MNFNVARSTVAVCLIVVAVVVLRAGRTVRLNYPLVGGKKPAESQPMPGPKDVIIRDPAVKQYEGPSQRNVGDLGGRNRVRFHLVEARVFRVNETQALNVQGVRGIRQQDTREGLEAGPPSVSEYKGRANLYVFCDSLNEDVLSWRLARIFEGSANSNRPIWERSEPSWPEAYPGPLIFTHLPLDGGDIVLCSFDLQARKVKLLRRIAGSLSGLFTKYASLSVHFPELKPEHSSCHDPDNHKGAREDSHPPVRISAPFLGGTLMLLGSVLDFVATWLVGLKIWDCPTSLRRLLCILCAVALVGISIAFIWHGLGLVLGC